MNLITNKRTIDPKDIPDNVIKLVGTDWMLITAGTGEAWNTMTASWGGMGFLWNRNVAFCVIRPGRHTFGFMERNEHFTLSFFDDSWRKALNLCGIETGREVDKAAATGLIPVACPHGGVSFEQARLVLECRKLYSHDLDPEHFLDPALMAHYPQHDYHRMYVAEILACHLEEV